VTYNRIKDKVLLDLKMREMIRKEEKEYDKKHNFHLLNSSSRGAGRLTKFEKAK